VLIFAFNFFMNLSLTCSTVSESLLKRVCMQGEDEAGAREDSEGSRHKDKKW